MLSEEKCPFGDRCLEFLSESIDVGLLKKSFFLSLWHIADLGDGTSHSLEADVCTKESNQIAHIKMPIRFCPICGKEF